MPAHPGIPGCNTYVDDLSYSPQHDQDPKCPTCGQKRIHIAEVEIASYAEARRISPDDPAAVEMAIRELRNDPHSPQWLQDAAITTRDQHFVNLRGPLACVHQGVIAPESSIAGRGHLVFVDDAPLSPQRSQQIKNHSPNGFAWGYSGSGPSQLALALLLEAGASEWEALRWYQDFKESHIATLDVNGDLDMKGAIITDWLNLCRANSA